MKKIFVSLLFFGFLNAKSQNIINIPDPNFLKALTSTIVGVGVDINHDGIIQLSEAQTVTSLNVSGFNIYNVTGLEAFTSLSTLYCNSNHISTLDLSKNTALTIVGCTYNSLTSLDLSKNTNLQTLYCDNNNGLTNLNLTKCAKLTTLSCGYCNLLTLDVTNNLMLTSLYCQKTLGNSIINFNLTCGPYTLSSNSLDLSKNIALQNLICSCNGLSKLDLSKNTSLLTLNCSNNGIGPWLDISKNTLLTTLNCTNNRLTFNGSSPYALDIRNNPNLTNVQCSGNSMTVVCITNTQNTFGWTKDNNTAWLPTCAINNGYPTNIIDEQLFNDNKIPLKISTLMGQEIDDINHPTNTVLIYHYLDGSVKKVLKQE